jgi:drug/metabolite transporter (DMT)-like permease
MRSRRHSFIRFIFVDRKLRSYSLTSPNTATLAILVMAGVNIIWGAAYPLTKPALETIPPFTFTFLRFVVAMAVLLPAAGRPALALLRGPDRNRLIIMGAFGFCFTQLAQSVALSLSPASDIALINAMWPLWIALLAWFMLRERLGRWSWLGFPLAIVGMVLIIWPQEGLTTTASVQRVIGDLLFFGCGGAWALYNVMGKEVMARHDPIPATTAAGLVGTLMLIPFAAWEWGTGQRLTATWAGVIAVGYTGLLVTVLGFVVLFWAYRRAGAAQLGVLMYLQPLAGVGLAWWLLGERLNNGFLVGAVLVLAGVGLATWNNNR